MSASRYLLARSPYEADHGFLIGRDPDDVTVDEWKASNVPLLIGYKAIRAKCLDCAESAMEVRKCVVVTCPLWPLRMGRQPKHYATARGVEPKAKASTGGDEE